MLWKKKEKEKKAEKRICGCELCRLSARLDEKIVGKQDREMVSPLVISPSTVKETDPMKKLEEAKKLEERGNVGGAARSYRWAAVSALIKAEDYDKYWAEYSNFSSRVNLPKYVPEYSNDIECYEKLKERGYLIEILRSTYREFIQPKEEKTSA